MRKVRTGRQPGSTPNRWSIATLFLLAFLAASSICSAQESSGFLLRQHLRIVVASQGVDATIERIIFRDGLIVTVYLTADQTYLRRRRATPEALAQLHAAFRRFRIGSQIGNCHAGLTPFDFFSDTTTYFTQGPKGHTFRTGDAYPGLCSLRLRRLKDEIFNFVDTAPAEPGLQEVLVPN